MIVGVPREELSLRNILSKIDEYQIYRHYIGKDFRLGKPFCSPFRPETDPSFSIVANGQGQLHFTDFGDGSRGKVVDFVSKFYPGRNFNDLLKCIDQDLCLGINTSFGNSTRPAIVTARHEQTKKDTLIQVIPKRFGEKELKYWHDYHLELEDLKRHNVYAIKTLYVDKQLVPIADGELVYGYLVDGKYWKIYRPLARSHRDKWISNVPHTLMVGLSNLKKGRPGIVGKAHKDFMVILKVYPHVCYTQSEGTNVISPGNLVFLQSECSDVFINFDPDAAGVRACNHYTSNYPFKALRVPNKYFQYGIKDMAEVSRSYDLKAVESILKSNKIQ